MRLFKEVNYTLSLILSNIELGEIGLPDIQRPFVWPNTKVRDLFDSMYKGFPVGYLLFWSNGSGNGHRQIGAGAKQKVPRLLIVDGQQRLTSLFAVLKNQPVIREDFKQETIQIAFRPADSKFEVGSAATRRDPEFIPDISRLWSPTSSRRHVVKEFIRRLRVSRPLTEAEEDHLNESIDRLYDLHHYPFTALELAPNVDEEQVSDVFVRINSKGTPLNQADFILTLMSVFWDEGRTDLEAFCRATRKPALSGPSSFNHFLQPDPDHLLRVSVAVGFRRARLRYVYSILRGKDLESGEFSDERRNSQFETLKRAQSQTLDVQDWHEFFKAIIRAGYRGSEWISSRVGLLYAYALFLIGKHDFRVEPYVLRNLIAKWYFMTALTGRYTDSPESRMEEDLASLREVRDAAEFESFLNRIIAGTFTDDYWNITLPNELATSSARSPSLFAYTASLSLLNAKVLFSNLRAAELTDPALRSKRSALERHHLFPKKYLASLGIRSRREMNQIANYAYVEWSDNTKISAKPPAEYVPQHRARFSEQELMEMYYWHALPPHWENMPYPDFLAERRDRMAHVIRDGYKQLCASGQTTAA